MSKQQTAVEWLITELKKTDMGRNLLEQRYNKTLINKAKAMEKEQIVDAVDGHPIQNRHLDGEQYYNETYNNNDTNSS